MLKDFISHETLVTCRPDNSITEVAKLMQEHDVGSVLVMSENKPVGIITDRDLVLRCMSSGTECGKHPASEHMTKSVVTVTEESGIHDVISLMQERSVRRIVFCDKKGSPLGIVSQGDILKLLAMEMNELARGTAPKTDKLIGEQKRRAS